MHGSRCQVNETDSSVVLRLLSYTFVYRMFQDSGLFPDALGKASTCGPISRESLVDSEKYFILTLMSSSAPEYIEHHEIRK